MDTTGSATPSAHEVALLRKLARLARIGAWEFDAATERMLWTDEASRLLEVDAATFTPTLSNTLAFFAPEARALAGQAVKAALERGTPWDLELALVTARGRPIWVRARGEPEMYEGRCARLACTLEDITDARAAREALRARTAESRKLALVAENTSDLVLITDGAHRIEWANPRFEQVTGWRAADLAGKTPAMVLFGPRDGAVLEQAAALLRRAASTGTPVALQRKDGSEFWVEIEQQTAHDESGAVTHHIEILRDVSARRAARQREQDLAQRLRLIASSTRVGIFERDLDTGVGVWDEEAFRLLGFAPGPGAPPLAAMLARVHPDDRAAYQAYLDDVLRGSLARDIEYRVVYDDGRVGHIHERGSAERAPGGRRFVIGIVFDMTEQRVAERHALATAEQLALAVSATGIGFYLVAGDSGAWVCDAQAGALLGLAPRESRLEQAEIEARVPPEDLAQVRRLRADRVVAEGAAEVSFRIQRRDGTQGWLRARCAVAPSAAGRPARVLGIVVDISAEKDRAQQQVLQQERLGLTLGAAGIGTWETDLVTGATVWSPELRAIVGIAPDAPALGGNAVMQIIVEEDRARIECERGVVPPPGGFAEHEYRIRRPDGEVRHVLTRRAAQYDANGRPLRVLGVTFDVTDARRAAEALREAMSRLELATAGAGVGVFSRNLVTNQAYWDEQTFHLFGLPKAARPPDWPELVAALHPDDRARYGAVLANAAKTGEFPDSELRVVTTEGTIRYLLVRGRTECAADGTLRSLAGVVLDITARKEAEHRATEYAEWLRLATTSMGIGFAQRDLRARVGTWSPEAKRLFGVDVDAPTPTPQEFLARVFPADKERTLLVMNTPPGPGKTTEVEIGVQPLKGDARRVLLRFAAHHDADGSPRQLFAAAIDVTATRAAETRLHAAQRRLELATSGSALGIWERDLDREHAYWSRENFALWGVPEAPVAPTLDELIMRVHADDRAMFQGQWVKLVSSAEFVDSEFRVLRADGSETWLMTRGRLDPGDADRAPHVIGVTLDITLRKRAERRASEMAGWLGLATRTVGIGLWYRDPSQERPVWDAQMFRLFGLNAGAGTPSNEEWLATILEEDRKPLAAVYNELPPPKTTLSFEYRIRRSDGEIRHLQSRRACLYDSAGRPQRVFGAVTDITETRVAGAALQAAQARLSLAAEVSGIASWERNLETGEARWDPQLFRFYGLAPTDQPLGLDQIIERIHPDDRKRFQEGFHRLYESAGTVEWEVRVMRPDGSMGHLLSRARTERHADGRPWRAVGASLDVTNMRRTAQKLQEALERLRLAGEASGIGTWERELDTDIAVWDSTMYRLYGLPDTGKAITRQQAVALVHADDRQRVIEAWRNIRETDQAVEFSFRVVQPDGSVRHLTARGRLERHADGRPWRVLGATIDVTEARRTADELRAALEHLRLVGETARIGTWERDLATNTARWDGAMKRLWGLAPDAPALDRDQVLQRVHADDREALSAVWQRMVQTDEPIEYEYRITRPDGTPVTLQSRARVERDAEGRPRRALGATIDVTASRLAQQQLREFDDWLRLAGTTIGVGFFLHPLDGRPHYNDPQIRSIFGFAEDARTSEQDYMDRLLPEDRDLMRAARAQALSSDVPVEMEYRIRLPDGAVRHVLTRRSLQRDAQGKPLQIFGIALDVTESRIAARALHAANERLQLATTTARIGIWEQDLVQGAMQWDERQRAIHGVDQDWVPDFERWLALVHPADRERLRQLMVAPTRSGSIEYRIVRPDGALRTLVGNFTLESDANAMPLRLLGTNLDVTDVRAAQRERDALVERMQIISETVGVGVWDWDPDTNTSVWNDRMYELFGHTRDSFGVRTWLDMLHPDDVPGAEAAMQAALGDGASFDIEFRVVWPDGGVHWIASRGRAERDAQGHTVRVLGVNMDITDRRRSEQATRDLLERMQLTTQATGIGLWEFDMTSRTLKWDDQLYRLVGRTAQDLPDLLRNWTSVLHPEDADRLVRAQRQALRERRALDMEVRVLLPGGVVRYLTLRGQLRFDADDRPVTQFGVAFDVTEHKLTETALRAKETAERASQAKTEFLSRMSHELRTPLNAILGFTQILEIDQSNPLAPVQRDRVQHIQQAGWHLLSLINEILDLSRIEAGKARLSMAIVPLGEVVDECLALVGTDAAKRQIDTVVLRQTNAPEAVWADRTRVKQVLLNILSNAVKYNREQGSVRITLGSDGEGNAVIAVRDTGIGLSAKQIDQLFQPFNRLGLESAQIEGTGIGLALSLSLTEQMGGKLEVSSEPGVGTEFRVTLPVATAGGDHAQDGPRGFGDLGALGTPNPDVRGSVLYVEDNPDNVTVVEEILSLRPNVTLFTAPDGATARVLAAACQPDLILLDMRLPDTDGFTLFAELRAQPETRDIPCAGVSANALPSDAAHARSAGFVEYWTKPLDAGLFLRGIDGLLTSGR